MTIIRDNRLKGNRRLQACWVLATLWFVAFSWATVAPVSAIGMASQGIQFMVLVAFVVIHASLAGGWRGALSFMAIVCIVSYTLEAISVATGFPFGFFTHHTDIGPKPFGVPLLVAVGYATFGWLAWAQTRSIVRAMFGETDARWLCIAPIIGAFVLTGYDYPYDAVGATVIKLHSYRHPTGMYGVPLTNFLGWLLTAWTAFQIYVFLERRMTPTAAAQQVSYGLLPSLIWIFMALSYVVKYMASPDGTTSVGDRTFVIADVFETSVIVGLPAMIFPAILAIAAQFARSHDRRETKTGTASDSRSVRANGHS